MDPQQYLTGLLTGQADFELLAAELLQKDDARRRGAEDIFKELKKQSPDATLTYLIKTIRTSHLTEHKSLAAILIRRSTIKIELIAAVQQEQSRPVQKQVADSLSEIAGYLLSEDANSWPEFLPFLYHQLQTSTGHALENALTILAEMAPVLTESFTNQLGGVQQLLSQHLQNASKEIQVAALNALTSIILCLEEQPQEMNKFQPLLPAMLNVVAQFNDEDLERTALELIISVAESEPKFLKPQLVPLVQLMLQMSASPQLEAETRMLAAEFLLTLCEAHQKAASITGALRKMPNFTETMYNTLMNFLLDIEDDAQWHTSDSEATEDAGEGELCQCGQESLDRLAIAMGGKALVPCAGLMLPAWLQDADWKKRHATLICLAQITEGCQKVMLESPGILGGLVEMCLKGLQDVHPRVRWAACQALGQMCSDLGPTLQEDQHARIVPALMAAMDDVSSPRVQAHASAAVVNFAEQCEKELVTPYLNALIGKLLALLEQNRSRIVQEGALTALASVADAAEDYFVMFYDHVMPRLIQILVGATDKSHRLLRAKALECISLVAMSVGHEKFRNDAPTVFNFMRQYNMSEVEADDPTSSYMLQAGARMCKCLGEAIVPYLDIVMPHLLKSANLQPDVKVRRQEDVEEEEEDDGAVEHIELGDKVLSIRTSTLEEKATACSMLCCYAEELKASFHPYVSAVTQLMVPLLTFYFHEQVRKSAAQCLPCLVTSVVRACARQPNLMGSVSNEAYISQIVSFLWDPLLAAAKVEPDYEVQQAQLEAMADIIKVLEIQYIMDDMVHKAFELYKDVLQKTEERRVKRLKSLEGEELDDETLEKLEAEQAEDEEVADSVCTGIGYFLRKFGDRVMVFVEPLVLTYFAPMLDKKRGGDERRIAACVLDDILEHSQLGRDKYLQQALPMLLDGTQDKHEDLRQCCAYGLKVAAVMAGAAFKPHAPHAMHVLLGVITKPDARNEDNGQATDNAISALGKIIEHHPDIASDPKVVATWLKSLPLEDDPTEALLMHELLVKMLEAQDARLQLGPDVLAHIAGVMVKVLGHGTDLIDGPVGLRMAALLRQLQNSIPADLITGLVQRLSPFEQQHFSTYMEGRIPEDSDS